MFDILYLVVILYVLFLSIKNNINGLYLLIGLLPFYTILREMTGGQIIFFVWPYIIIFVYMINSSINSLHNHEVLNRYRNKLLVLNFVLVPLFYLILIAASGGLGLIIDGDLKKFVTLLTDEFIVLSLFPILYYVFQYFYLYFYKKANSEGYKYLLADGLVCLFLLYGFFHIFLSWVQEKSLFNALTQFRYYFSMALIYFLVREWVYKKEEMKKLEGIGVVVFSIAFMFFYIEGLLLNCLNVAPSDLPWAGVLYELFEFSPRTGDSKVFLEASYSPIGIMYSQHLSGLFLVVGFALYYPILIHRISIREIKGNVYILLLVLLLPLSLLYTSKTVIILYVFSIVSTMILMYRKWRVAVPVSIVFLTVIPYVYSNYCLPCMKHDILREFSYLVAAGTPVNEKAEEDGGLEKNLSAKKKGILSCVYCDVEEDQRVLNNAFVNLMGAVLVDVEGVSASKITIWQKIFGSGYSLSGWAETLQTKEINIYKEVSYSDTPYLKFFQQFGVVGIMIFVIMSAFISFLGIKLWWSKYKFDPAVMGLVIITPLAIIATAHLQIFFKTGLNSVVFIVMALVVSLYIKIKYRCE